MKMEGRDEMGIRTDSNDEDTRVSLAKVCFDLCIVLVAILFLVTSYTYMGETGMFARVVGYPISVLGMIMIAIDLKRIRSRSPRPAPQGRTGFRFPFLPLGLAVAYFLLFFGIGFIAGTLVFLTLVPWLVLKEPVKRVPLILATSIVLTLIFVVLFGMGSGVILPHGLIGRVF